MSDQVPPGYYRDQQGKLRKDRRRTGDRRKASAAVGESDRRAGIRRQADRSLIEREHHQMIEDALEEFAAEHEVG